MLEEIEEVLREQSLESSSLPLPTFRQVQESVKKEGTQPTGRRTLSLGEGAFRILNWVTASSPRTIEVEKRNQRLRDFDRERYNRDEAYKSQINRDAKEVARERGCYGC